QLHEITAPRLRIAGARWQDWFRSKGEKSRALSPQHYAPDCGSSHSAFPGWTGTWTGLTSGESQRVLKMARRASAPMRQCQLQPQRLPVRRNVVPPAPEDGAT